LVVEAWDKGVEFFILRIYRLYIGIGRGGHPKFITFYSSGETFCVLIIENGWVVPEGTPLIVKVAFLLV